MNNNIMTLNDKDVGISKIELNESDLLITDKSGKYCLKICLQYNWKDIYQINEGEKKEIDFNEYYLSENNEPALIWPSICYVEKVEDDSISFYLKFNDLVHRTHYMNKKGCFDIELREIEVKVFIDYKDAIDGEIVYCF